MRQFEKSSKLQNVLYFPMHCDRCNRHLNSMYLTLWSSVKKRQHFQCVSATEALLILLRRQRVIKDTIAKRLHSGVHKSLLTADPGLKYVLYNKEINGLR